MIWSLKQTNPIKARVSLVSSDLGDAALAWVVLVRKIKARDAEDFPLDSVPWREDLVSASRRVSPGLTVRLLAKDSKALVLPSEGSGQAPKPSVSLPVREDLDAEWAVQDLVSRLDSAADHSLNDSKRDGWRDLLSVCARHRHRSSGPEINNGVKENKSRNPVHATYSADSTKTGTA